MFAGRPGGGAGLVLRNSEQAVLCLLEHHTPPVVGLGEGFRSDLVELVTKGVDHFERGVVVVSVSDLSGIAPIRGNAASESRH